MKPELIMTNGKVYSVTEDDVVIHAEAIAVKEGKILSVGNASDIMAYVGDETEIIDCCGNTVLPGLCDAHCHPSIAMTSMNSADLFGVYREEGQTADDVIDIILEKLAAYVEKHPEDKVIRGTGWVFTIFNPAERMPDRHDLDKICSDRPVILESFCQHNLWVNTKAIEIAGVDENTPDTVTGKIFREDGGYPCGVFSEPEAMRYIKEGVPGYDLSVDEYKSGIKWYQRECANKYGVTFVQDCMHSENAREAYRQMAEDGELTIRLRGVYLLRPEMYEQDMKEFIRRKGADNVGNDFRIDTIKIFAEGTPNLLDGYLPEYCREIGKDTDYNGKLHWSDEVFTEYAAKAMEEGFNIHVHAMGDGAVKQSVDCLVKAQRLTGRQPRNIVAHLMLAPDESVELMGKEKIIANCQPSWMMYEFDICEEMMSMGKEKAMQSYPLRKFLDKGVTVAFGTDFPVTPPPDTMQEICVAMTRCISPGTVGYEKFKGQPLGDEEPATLAEAVKSLSINGAFQMFGEKYAGSIQQGKSADIVILDSDIENMPPEEIYKVKVSKTFFKGKKVYDSEYENNTVG